MKTRSVVAIVLWSMVMTTGWLGLGTSLSTRIVYGDSPIMNEYFSIREGSAVAIVLSLAVITVSAVVIVRIVRKNRPSAGRATGKDTVRDGATASRTDRFNRHREAAIARQVRRAVHRDRRREEREDTERAIEAAIADDRIRRHQVPTDERSVGNSEYGKNNASSSADTRTDQWTCSRCGTSNHVLQIFCTKCGAAKPAIRK